MPEMLVVAIENTDRTRDMTPPTQEPRFAERMPTNGGAAGFRAFIADELVPWLDENYRTRPYRILVGHSFGGLFAIDFLVTRPDVFNGYIAISPSLQWNEQRLLDRVEAFFDDTDELNASLFMTAGNEGGGLVGGARKLAGILEEKAPAGLALASIGIPLREEGRLDELFGLLDRYRDTIQPPPPFLVQLAGQFRETGRAEQAVELYRLVLEADPDNEAARRALDELGNDHSDLVP